MARLLEQYKLKILPELKAELKLANDMAVPRLEKVIVNVGIGRILQQQPKSLDTIIETIARIVGQKPVSRQAKKSISAFKIREGQIVGLSVTLRGKRMYEFIDKLVNAALPRTRDFRGISRKGLDGKGNYSLGLREHIVFPEISGEDASMSFGVEVTIVTTARTDEAAYLLLKKLGFPFSAEGGSLPRRQAGASGGKSSK